jgi:hypothetical protein
MVDGGRHEVNARPGPPASPLGASEGESAAVLATSESGEPCPCSPPRVEERAFDAAAPSPRS